eukprot:365632-Chlamydomonas_euryale.AAC.8
MCKHTHPACNHACMLSAPFASHLHFLCKIGRHAVLVFAAAVILNTLALFNRQLSHCRRPHSWHGCSPACSGACAVSKNDGQRNATRCTAQDGPCENTTDRRGEQATSSLHVRCGHARRDHAADLTGFTAAATCSQPCATAQIAAIERSLRREMRGARWRLRRTVAAAKQSMRAMI